MRGVRNALQDEAIMKRSAVVTLALLGALTAAYGASRRSCDPSDWNDEKSCRSSSRLGVYFGRRSFRRGGFGKSGSAHSGGG